MPNCLWVNNALGSGVEIDQPLKWLERTYRRFLALGCTLRDFFRGKLLLDV